MRTVEIRALSVENLKAELEGANKELFNLRFQKSTQQLTDTNAPGKTRKKIAQIKTILLEKERSKKKSAKR